MARGQPEGSGREEKKKGRRMQQSLFSPTSFRRLDMRRKGKKKKKNDGCSAGFPQYMEFSWCQGRKIKKKEKEKKKK